MAAGATAYILAKRSINNDRAARLAIHEEKQRQQQSLRDLEAQELARTWKTRAANASTPLAANASASAGGSSGSVTENYSAFNPSNEGSEDPATTRHAPTTEGEQMSEKSKYEATEVFKSRKGDRLTGFR